MTWIINLCSGLFSRDNLFGLMDLAVSESNVGAKFLVIFDWDAVFGKLEILVPTLDRNLVPRLNLVRFFEATQSLQFVRFPESL